MSFADSRARDEDPGEDILRSLSDRRKIIEEELTIAREEGLNQYAALCEATLKEIDSMESQS
jgi:hypothetical protein